MRPGESTVRSNKWFQRTVLALRARPAPEPPRYPLRKYHVRMNTAVLTALLFFILLLYSGVSAEPKDQYRPYPHPYPQIIQAHDYPTIEAIEAVFSSLKKFGDGDVSCEVRGVGIIFKRRNDGAAVIEVPEKGSIRISERPYSAAETVVLFTTLKRVLTGLSETSMCSVVRFAQVATQSYAKRTIVEFQFGQTVVVVDSFSNCPADRELLYILDIVHRNQSFFWPQ